MADPRLATDTRIGAEPRRVLTFKADGSGDIVWSNVANGSAVVGRAVTLTGNGLIRLVGAAGAILGQLLSVEKDGRCAVLVRGVCALPGGAAATLTPGTALVGSLGGVGGTERGFVRTAAAATLAEVAVQTGTILDSSDATAVEVEL